LVGGGQSTGPRADDQDSLAAAGGRWFEHPAALSSKVTEEPLHRMDRYGAVEVGAVADGFTRVVAHSSVDCGKWVVRNELTPSLFVPAGGGVCKPGLDVFPRGATGVAGRQQIDVDGSPLARRPGPGPPMGQIRKRRHIHRRSGCARTGIAAGVLVAGHGQPENRTVVPGNSWTTRPRHSTSMPAASRGSTLMITPFPLTRRCRCRPR